MLTFTSSLSVKSEDLYPLPYGIEELLFFDIETTGFSAEIASVYLIGCTCYSDGCWHTMQWFADDYISEPLLLEAFFTELKRHRVLIHYNGTGFDIPFLLKKCRLLGLPYDFSEVESLDIYKKIKPFKGLLNLSDIRLKTMEKFLGIPRKDLLDGGELIQIYTSYIHGKFRNTTDKDVFLPILLLHNREDTENLISLTQLLAYPALFEQPHELDGLQIDGLTLTFRFMPDYPLRINFSRSWPISPSLISLTADQNGASLSVTACQGERKHFFSDYRDYYYLPAEDTAIHKSVAAYVDKAFREKAKASNCYIKKSGLFIPQFQDFIKPAFKMNYRDKLLWLEVDAAFTADSAGQAGYMSHLLRNLIKEWG